MRLTDIAEKINAHLKRFEADKKINKLNKHNTRPYYNAGARQGGNKIRVYYASYQGGTRLDKTAALRYLAWLDAGHVGTWFVCRNDHEFKMPKSGKKSCAGCGEALSTYQSMIRCGTGEVAVCPGRGGFNYDPNPKKSCAVKARAQLALCPGCDAEDTTPGTICHECQELLNRYQGLGDNEVHGYYLVEKLVGPYLGHFRDEDGSESEPARELLTLLCQVAAPEGLRRWQRGGFPDWASEALGGDSPTSGDPAVELDEGQKEALLRIGPAIAKLTRAQHLDGFRDGSGILRRLASGETSISEFNTVQLRAEGLYGPGEDSEEE